jgi:hypothetical protein
VAARYGEDGWERRTGEKIYYVGDGGVIAAISITAMHKYNHIIMYLHAVKEIEH